MSKPTYFKDFPNIQYALSINKAGQGNYIKIKDYFNLLVTRADIFKKDTIYSPYTIQGGMRPDQISYEVYGDEQFYWVILQINDIIDYYTQWPLSQNELTEFVYKKYGGVQGAGNVHHWETVETYDTSSTPNKVLPGGLVVPSTYIYYYPSTPGSNVTLSSLPTPVTNYEYEHLKNQEKSQIYILDQKYLGDYTREVRNYAKRLTPSVSNLDMSEVIQNA